MVYNDEIKAFKHPSHKDKIKALRKRSKKKVLHRKIQDRNDLILVKEVYYQVTNPSNPDYILGHSIKDEPEQPTWTQPKVEPETITDPEDLEDMTPGFIIPKRVLFDPKVENLTFNISLKPTPTSKPTFGKQLLDSPANLLLPTVPQTSTPDSRLLETSRRPGQGQTNSNNTGSGKPTRTQ
jgi:hypothetical protein